MEDSVLSNLTVADSLLHWSDYTILILILMLPVPIGLYYTFFANKHISLFEYILGDKDIKTIPIGLSLLASFISGITLTGIPSDVYLNGSLIWLTVPMMFFVCIFASYFFLPIYYDLEIRTAYEYLEIRFTRTVRLIGAVLYCVTNILFMPTLIYIPSMSLHKVTGISPFVTATGLICLAVLYASGGLRSIVWTNLVQIVIVMLICFIIAIIGTVYAGGLANVFTKAYNDGKMNIFVMDPNPFQRNTFWTMSIGVFVTWSCGLASSQVNVQRFLALPSINEAKQALLIFWTGLAAVLTLCTYGGYLAYAAFYGCDPLEQQLISQPDQIFPYFIMDKFGHLPVVSGIFMAGILGASVSAFSNILQTTACTIYEDLINKDGNHEENGRFRIKWIIGILGTFSYFMVIAFSRMETTLLAIIIIVTITIVPVSLLFVLGMMVPIANAKGAIAGAVSTMLFLSWITIGSTVSRANTLITNIYPEGLNTCPNVNISISDINIIDESNYDQLLTFEDPFILYQLSSQLYFPLGLLIGVLVGVIVSYITGRTDPATLRRSLISPPLRRFLPERIPTENAAAFDVLIIQTGKT